MIRPLRRGHRASVLVLAFVLPCAYFAALAARPAVEANTPSPGGDSLRWTLGRDAFGRCLLEVDARGASVIPDALVYWAPEAADALDLPGGSRLLGALPQDAARAFRLPDDARARPGVAIVFSLAWQKRLAQRSLEPCAPIEASR